MLQKDTEQFPQSEIEVKGNYDFIVCGGGLSGCAAAWESARSGLKTLIVEYYSKLGGVPSSGLLGIVSGFQVGNEQVVKGDFFSELLLRMQNLNAVTSRDDWAFRFDPEKLAMVLLDMLEEKGVNVLLQTHAISASCVNNKVKYIVTASKAGLEAWRGKLFADATGDADIAAMCGCECKYGREQDGMVQSSSLTFKLAGIDMSRIPSSMTEATAIWKKEPHLTKTNHTVITYLPNTNGEAAVNMSHILSCHPLTHEGLSRIRREGMRQAYEIADFFRKNLSGFEKCYVAETAMQPGIRESRRITGKYTLNDKDVIEGRDFDNEIARCMWGIDIHVPDKIHGETPMPHFCLEKSFAIPYECITPPLLENLYVTGRAISATHEAIAAARINATCMAVGEAAGIAAKLAIQSGNIHKINIKQLQKLLAERHCIFHRTEKDTEK